MYDVAIARPDDLAQFRAAARALIAAGTEPAAVLWRESADRPLLGAPLASDAAALSVPAGAPS